MDEFDLIQRYFKGCGVHNRQVVERVGDDGAILTVSDGCSAVVCADTMVRGVHFFPEASPENVGYKLAMINLSDIAAMGARPVWATLCLTLPKVDEIWLERFSTGLYEALDIYDVELVGGDTTRGPLTLSLQLGGEVPDGQALTRRGACIGDEVWVSGSLGGAAYALDLFAGGGNAETISLVGEWSQRLERPEARVALGLALKGLATACIDVSDGLLSDARHVCQSSKVGMDLELSALPIHKELMMSDLGSDVLRYVLAGGDDYELLFTANPTRGGDIGELSTDLGIDITKIGVVTDSHCVKCLQNDVDVSADFEQLKGFNHFAE